MTKDKLDKGIENFASELGNLFKKSKGKKKKKKTTVSEEVKDWIVSFIIAATIYFIIMPAVFNSSSPAVVVSSCSEKGNLDIGDIIFVAGVKVKDINAPMVNIDGKLEIEPVIENPDLIDKLLINGQLVEFDNDNDIAIYTSRPYNYQIIHHAFAILNISNQYILLTKGAANPMPDQLGKGAICISENPNLCLSTAIDDNLLVGRRVLPTVPLFGHVKLFFCDITGNMLCEGHSNAGTAYEYMLTC